MQQENKGLNISAKSFIAAILIIFALMLATYLLTFLIPGGEYLRMLDENGNTVIDTAAGFRSVEGGLPLWKWLLSPILVLGAEGSATLIAVIQISAANEAAKSLDDAARDFEKAADDFDRSMDNIRFDF